MNQWAFEYTIDTDVENGVVYEKIYGIWRAETAKHYHADFQREVAELIKKPWVKLIDLCNWKTGSAEVIQIVGKHLDWCRQHNMQLSVNIINNTVTYGQLQRMFARGRTKDVSKTFRSREEAEQFLRDQGWNIRKSNGTRYQR